MKPNESSRVALIGPESSGKTTLCRALAEKLSVPWVPEYAREYLNSLSRPYTIEDILLMARKQSDTENSISRGAQLIFCDTEPINFKVWCEAVFGYCPDEISSMVSGNQYHLYILTSPDLPWEYDPLRENPGRSLYFFDWYKRILDELGRNYVVVSGSLQQRLDTSLDAVQKATGFVSLKK